MTNQKNITTKKTIIVLGMHRSGTSAVAGILNILGVDMGSKLQEKDAFNPQGYFEDLEFQSLNKEILNYNNASWKKPPSKFLKTNTKLNKKIKELIKKKRKSFWGWKDPRTVFTINKFIPNISNPYVIVCLRNPLKIALSLKERDGLAILEGLKLSNSYNQAIFKFLESYPKISHLFISLEDILNNPTKEAKKVSSFLGLTITTGVKQKINKLITSPSSIQKARTRLRKQEIEKELQTIYNSRGWKILTFIHKLRLKIPFLKNI